MKPNRIFICRHGQSLTNDDRSVGERVQDHKVGLTMKGHGQAQELGRQLRNLGVGYHSAEKSASYVPTWNNAGRRSRYGMWISPFERARQTAYDVLDNLDPKFLSFKKEDPRIREQEWGHLRSVGENARIDAERDAYSRFYYRIPDGESGADVFDRVKGFFETLHRDFEKEDHPEDLVVITHGFTARIMVMAWLHYLVEQFELMDNPVNCGFYVLGLNSSNKYELVRSAVLTTDVPGI